MSEKDFHERVIEQANSTDRTDDTKEEAAPKAFYQVPCCPSCQEDGLSHCDFGVFHRSHFLGMTSDGHKGCGRIEEDSEDPVS